MLFFPLCSVGLMTKNEITKIASMPRISPGQNSLGVPTTVLPVGTLAVGLFDTEFKATTLVKSTAKNIAAII